MMNRDISHICSRANWRLWAAAVAMSCGTCQTYAAEIKTNNPDLSIRWDNTIKYTSAWRVKGRSDSMVSGDYFSPNVDDADRNFDKGLISNRLDLLSEFDLVYKDNLGFRVSAAAWYDAVYNQSNDHDSPDTSSRAYGEYNEFSPATEKLHGRKTELLDAFVFGGFDIGNSRLNLRLGKHSIQWGESLFFGSNGIAGAMAPVDVIKLVSVPSTQFKEAILPVPQISAQWQLGNNVSLGAYYQFGWKASRLTAAGSYFAVVDHLPEGGEELMLGDATLYRMDNLQAQNSGQGGLQLRFSVGETDFGLYAVRFHAKSHQLTTILGFDADHAVVPLAYRLDYHEGTTAYGASASRTFGTVQASVEASIRRDQDLSTTGAVDTGLLTGSAPNTDNDSNPAYATGKTAHFNLSTIWTLPSTAFAREATFTGEFVWNRVLSVDKNAAAIDPNATRDAAALRFTLEPTYRQVIPGVDISVPFGMGYSPKGSRSMALGPIFPAENGGDITIGINGNYLDVWRFSLSYTQYYGSENPFMAGTTPSYTYGQYLKDRNFVSLSLRRTF